MQVKKNYEFHENIYQKLKAKSSPGWGGDSFETRMQDWRLSIDKLKTNTLFPKPPAKILEIGSGAGDVSIQLANLGYAVFGVEISTTAVKWANEKSKDLKLSAQFFQGDVCDLSQFKDNSFQVVIDGNCLHCIIGEDRTKLLKEIYRVLTPQGLFFVSTMMGDPQNLNENVSFDPISRCQIENSVPVRYMGQKEDIQNELTSAGFRILETKVKEKVWWKHMECLVQK